MSYVPGIDIARYQGHIDWPRVAAAHVLGLYTPAPGDLVYALDIEAARPVGLDLASWAESWCSAVESATGASPMIYSYRQYLSTYIPKRHVLTRRPLWIAHCCNHDDPGDVPPWSTWQIWQHSSQGSIPGVHHRVNLNWARDADTLDGLRHGEGG